MKSAPPPRRHRFLRLSLLAPVAVLAAGLSIVRVPVGSVGACGRSLLRAGWHLRVPLAHVRQVPVEGRLAAIEVIQRTKEGAGLAVWLDVAYRLIPDALAGRAGTIAERGLGPVIAAVAADALASLPQSGVVPPDLPAGRGGSVPLLRPAIEAIAQRLRQAGIEPLDLTASIGAPGANRSPSGPPGPDGAATNEGVRATPPPAAGSAGGVMPRPEPTGIRLLIIGLDAADWETIDPLLEAGRLPNLARLVKNGARGPLRSYDPMISPLLWTTMVTGLGPDRHGIADFMAIDEATGRRIPITSRFRKVKALWNILSDAGRSSAFVAWWASYPAEKVDGFQVTNIVSYKTLRPPPPDAAPPEGVTYPPDYFDRIRPSLITASGVTYEEVRRLVRIDRAEFDAALREVLRPREKDDESPNREAMQKPVALVISILTAARNYATIAADLAARRLDMTAVYFEGIDMMGHRFQHCMPPRMALCPDEDYVRYRDAVSSFYVRQDELLGPILEAAGPGTTVLVVSDHGFKSGPGRPVDTLPFTTQEPVEWHREDGIFILSGPGARRGGRLTARATLFDIAPTILDLLGMPTASEMPGRPLLEALDPGWVRAHPERTIPSYEPLGGPREVIASGGEGVEEAEQELLSNLKALGYVGAETVARGRPGAAGREAAGTQVFYHRNLATYFLKRRDYEKAAEQLRLANQREKLPKTYQMLSEAYVGMGRTEEAIATLEEGLKQFDSYDPEPVLWIVQIRLASPSGRGAAIETARRWAARTAKKAGLDDAIAGVLQESEGDPSAAAALYRRSLLADPTRVVAAQRLYALEGSRAAADLEPVLEKALAKDPRIDEYDDLLGAILASTGRVRESLQAFRRAADLDPDNPRFAANVAAALVRLARWDEAAAAYEKAAALDPSPGNFLKLGSVYRRLRRPDRALAAFERARAAGDSGSGLFLGIALARAEMNQIPQALATAKEGLDRHPDDPGLRSLYADLLRRTRTPGSPLGPPGSGR